LKRRITFKGVEKYMEFLQDRFYENSFNPSDQPENEVAVLLHNLKEIKRVLTDYHDGLFVELVDDLIRKIRTFGCFFATMDIRQDSSVIRQTHDYVRTAHPEATRLPADFDQLDEAGKLGAFRFEATDFGYDETVHPLVA